MEEIVGCWGGEEGEECCGHAGGAGYVEVEDGVGEGLVFGVRGVGK